jgi:hypothetical protein
MRVIYGFCMICFDDRLDVVGRILAATQKVAGTTESFRNLLSTNICVICVSTNMSYMFIMVQGVIYLYVCIYKKFI